MQKHVILVDLVKSFPTHFLLQNLASIQQRKSPIKFAHLTEKSGKGSISNLSTKVPPPLSYWAPGFPLENGGYPAYYYYLPHDWSAGLEMRCKC